jgi:hypothetical protein
VIPGDRSATEEILEIGLEGFDVWVQTPSLKKPIPSGTLQSRYLSMLDSSNSLTTDQLNSTSLKWGSDGELSELDLQRILGLLSQVDPVAEALIEGRSEAA